MSSGGILGIESVAYHPHPGVAAFAGVGKDEPVVGGWSTVGSFEETAVLREIADREPQETDADSPTDLKVGYQGEPGAFGEVAAVAHGRPPVSRLSTGIEGASGRALPETWPPAGPRST